MRKKEALLYAIDHSGMIENSLRHILTTTLIKKKYRVIPEIPRYFIFNYLKPCQLFLRIEKLFDIKQT